MSSESTFGGTQMEADGQWEPLGQSLGCADHDPDLIHDLSLRLDALWRHDQFIANAKGHPGLQACWQGFKTQEMSNVARLKALIGKEIEEGCFQDPPIRRHGDQEIM